MRRAVPVLAATGGVLALLANFHTSPAPHGVTVASPDPATTTEPTTVPRTTTTLAPLPTFPSPSTAPSTTTTTLPNGEVALDGPITSNKWGDVQVRVVLEDRRIVDVQALQLPDSNSHSAALSRAVQSRLRTEVLQAQTAHVDGVSGATLTSDNYTQSLQGALDRAGH
jgi:uncharacterized protein with FMN-binding domain